MSDLTALSCFSYSEPSPGVGLLTMNRPEHLNSMNTAFWQELSLAIKALDQLGTTRALVIASTGKHFSAGMDLSVFSSSAALRTDTVADRQAFRTQLRELQACISALANARFPVIAAIQGGCIGGAVDMVTACCLRYCSSQAYLTIAEINLGMMADVGTMNRAPKQLPDAVMREMAYLGNKLSAERAYQVGFVNGVAQDAPAALALALNAAAIIAEKSPLAITASKEMISYSRDHAVDESFTYMNALQPGIFDPLAIAQSMAAAKTGKAAAHPDNVPLNPPIAMKR